MAFKKPPPTSASHSSAHHPHPLVRDFILVAEFSEQEGPKPLLTIPGDAAGDCDFDQNTFAVRIMAVDYQAQNRENHFKFAVDTQVVQSEEDERVSAHVYVHHFTLYDVYARGYVRPFCMCYVTGDQPKLMLNFEDIRRQFSYVSETLHVTNLRVFERDLKKRIADFKHSEKCLQDQMTTMMFDTNSVDDDSDEVTRLTKTGEYLHTKEVTEVNGSCIETEEMTNEANDDDEDAIWHQGFNVNQHRQTDIGEIRFQLESVKSNLDDMENIEKSLIQELTKESVASKLHKLDSKQDRIGQVPRHDVQQHNESHVNPVAEPPMPTSPLYCYSFRWLTLSFVDSFVSCF
ncbi:guanine nucleotide exchange protein SMCR8-like [Corticium candelabrum]|uniref:guanine nucleotide exchange protein SMCR8-like n=1 Tax=Corticium candelabrum TaxID=121492 RepID=UPI002E25EF9B|nr:guanine nucleotide exchange protein SMCR8-like [Corticium candelabrum]